MFEMKPLKENFSKYQWCKSWGGGCIPMSWARIFFHVVEFYMVYCDDINSTLIYMY